jgi:hypothetical protein
MMPPPCYLLWRPDLVGLVATELGASEVTDLCRIDNADDVARLVQYQRHAEAVTAGRLHADMACLLPMALSQVRTSFQPSGLFSKVLPCRIWPLAL